MKATITDAEALRALSPEAITAYLQASGWRREEIRNANARCWLLPTEDGEYEVEQRLAQDADDYARRVAEMLATLAIAEDRSQLIIYLEILAGAATV